MIEGGTLTYEDARAFYDRFGAKQDWQRLYEDPALGDLIRHGAFEEAQAVLEFGCGTGRLAARLLRDHLPGTASYLGVDVSATMVARTRGRLAGFGDRVRVDHTEGSPRLALPSSSYDRFISTYVLDLLAADDIRVLLAEAHRLLAPGGRLGLVSLTHGVTTVARLVERLWMRVYRAHPTWLGGCRPVSLAEFVRSGWQVTHRAVVTSLAISSEILVAEKLSEANSRVDR